MSYGETPYTIRLENGLVYHAYVKTDSTNDRAVDWLRSGGEEQELMVVTSVQEEGRGQRGKRWSTAAGLDLACSYARRFELSFQPQAQHLPALNMEISMAVRDAVLACSGAAIRSEDLLLKWPNDLYLRAFGSFRKLGGILLETHWKGMQLAGIIAGIGMNLRSERLGESYLAVSLAEATGCCPDEQELLREITTRLRVLSVLQPGIGTAEIRSTYNGLLLHRNDRRFFKHEGSIKSGTFLGVQPDGHGLFLWEGTEQAVAVASGHVTWIWDELRKD